jgi:hypothetical protein
MIVGTSFFLFDFLQLLKQVSGIPIIASVLALLLFNVFSEIGVDIKHPVSEAVPHVICIQVSAPDKQPDGLKKIKDVLRFGRISRASLPFFSDLPSISGPWLVLEFPNEIDQVFNLFSLACLFQLLMRIDEGANTSHRDDCRARPRHPVRN